jgi:hypothetical protein
LSSLVRQADDEEVKELRRVKEYSQKLENDFAALQKRHKDQDGRVANAERAAFTARQSLQQAQQRAAEWEKRAKDDEAEMESLRSKLEDADQARSTLDTDLSLVKLQLEEKDAHDRLSKVGICDLSMVSILTVAGPQDRESKLRDQVATLEQRLARMQVEVDEAKKTSALATPKMSNGKANGTVLRTPRPESRSSTIYSQNHIKTPTTNGRPASPASTVRTATPPAYQPSVRDSMHAPKRYPSNLGIVTPQARRPHLAAYYQRSAPSPTPSVVSNAPTLGEDGWWS